MLRFNETKVANRKFHGSKKSIEIGDVGVGDVIVISKLVETKNNSKYLIRYLDQFIKLLVFILPKMSGDFNTFKVKGGDKKNKFPSLCINDEKLLEKYKTIWIYIKG